MAQKSDFSVDHRLSPPISPGLTLYDTSANICAIKENYLFLRKTIGARPAMIKETTINELMDAGLLSVRTRNTCLQNGLYCVGQIMEATVDSLLGAKRCGRKTIREILELKGKLIQEMSNNGGYKLHPMLPFIGEDGADTTGVLTVSDKVYEQAMADFNMMTFEQRREFDEAVKRNFFKMSVRARNIVPELRAPHNVVMQLYSRYRRNLIGKARCGTKTIGEIREFLEAVRLEFGRCIASGSHRATDNDSTPTVLNDPDEMQHMLDISSDFPFLSSDECIAAIEFKGRTGHLPYLTMIYIYITGESENQLRYIRDYFGLNDEMRRFTVSELAERNGLTRERVRQLVTAGIKLPDTLRTFVSEKLAPRLPRLVAFDAPEWREICADYMMEQDPRIARMVVSAAVNTHRYVAFEPEGPEFLVERELLDGIKLLSSIRELNRVASLRRLVPTDYDVRECVQQASDGPASDADGLAPLFVSYLQRRYEVSRVNGPVVTLAANVENVSAMAEEILRRKGSPMKCRDIFAEFCRQHPDSAVKDLSQFKPYMFRNPNIVARGRTGIYLLAEWPDGFSGTLTSYLAYLLEHNDGPMALGTLVSKAREEYPDTNEKSVYSLMQIDRERRFIFLVDGRIGLSSRRQEYDYCFDKPSRRRVTFEERLHQLQDFIAKADRLPNSGGDDEEVVLSRWIANVRRGMASAAAQQVERLDSLLEASRDLPQNSTECRFRENCGRVLDIVRATGALPRSVTHQQDYSWFHKWVRDYPSMPHGNRRQYFSRLLAEIRALGVEC